MILKHLTGKFIRSDKEWIKIRDRKISIAECFYKYILLLTAIPAVSAYIGAAVIGWDIGDRNFRFTYQSTIPLAVAFYLACIIGTAIIGKAIHWMAATYGASKDLSTCMLLSITILSPFFLSGIFASAPIPWLIFIMGLIAIAYAVYLLYTGIPIVMGINQERGFLFASAVLTIGLVTIVGILVATVSLWAMGLTPIHA
ncbi:Yip1 family protein [Cycloclasticus sp. P1]|uniref:Yip1 family protein n=1 Tax=Cycloclasticus sp. (strain P1) TaxID=385025 RepID=UPI000286AF80|nr:Yip1 family protein [Cycloclasticus sp. P1]AFT67095.1 Amino acid transporter [Cycloclasticus sp. P1]